MTQIDIKDRQGAERWRSEVEQLNTETEQILNRMNVTLATVATGAEGEIITTIATLCAQTVTATAQIVKGMKGLFDAVGNVINAFSGAIDSALGDMANTTRRFFNGG